MTDASQNTQTPTLQVYKMESPILACPTDILRLVLAHLSSADLHAVSLTSKALHTISEPFLYSKVQLTWTNTQAAPPIISLLQTVLQRPRVARFVRAVSLYGSDFEPNWHRYLHDNPRLEIHKDEMDILIKRVREMNVSYTGTWIQELSLGTMDAFVALLLSQLPNLRCLYLDKNFTRRSYFVGMVLRSSLCEEPRLSSFARLQDVSWAYFEPGIDVRHHTDARNTIDVLSLLYLPSVKSITAPIDNPVAFSWPAANPPDASSLETLDLSMIREGNLGQILSVTKGLRTLRWNWYYRDDLRDRFVRDVIDLDRITADLSHVRETLTELTISAETEVSRADPQFPPLAITGRFRTFSGLKALEHLCVPLPFLMGFEGTGLNDLSKALPESIERLTITDNLYLQEEWVWQDTALLEAIRIWLQDWRRSTPRLEEVHLFLGMLDYEEWGPELRQELRDVGAHAGIRVRITKVAGEM